MAFKTVLQQSYSYTDCIIYYWNNREHLWGFPNGTNRSGETLQTTWNDSKRKINSIFILLCISFRDPKINKFPFSNLNSIKISFLVRVPLDIMYLFTETKNKHTHLSIHQTLLLESLAVSKNNQLILTANVT